MGRRAIRALAVLSLLAILGGLILAAVIARYGGRDRARPADVIIVLGGGEGATPRRTVHGAALYRAGLASALLCAGGMTQAGFNEAQACARIAQEHGVPPAAILQEAHSRSTEENAIGAARIMAARGWRTAVIVSDNFHLWRARWIFAQQGIVGYPSPAQLTAGALPVDETLWALMREVAAVTWQAVKSALGLPLPARAGLISMRSLR